MLRDELSGVILCLFLSGIVGEVARGKVPSPMRVAIGASLLLAADAERESDADKSPVYLCRATKKREIETLGRRSLIYIM